MAEPAGATADSLKEQLRTTPWAFDFFQAVRRLECAHPERPRVGYSSHLSEDPVRFGQFPSLAFAPSALAQYVETGAAPRMSVEFFGLLGPNGPMPLHFSEFVRDRQRNRDTALARFLDLFHHRLLSLFYRAWACNQQTVGRDRPAEDRIAVYIASQFGMGIEHFRNRDEVPDVAKLYYSGRLVCGTRHAEGLAAIIADFFGVAADIQQCVGQWLNIPPEASCRLGGFGDSATLGRTAVIGTRVWDCQQKFRLRLGPMKFSHYQRLLPGGNSLGRMIAWVRNYANDEFDWDAQLILEKEEVPPLRLGQVGQLGWTTWLHSKPAPRDVDDLILRPMQAVSSAA